MSQKWKAPGVRADPRDRPRHLGLAVALRQQDEAGRSRRLETARRKWAEGLVIPAHISVALDAMGLYGPEVDAACGAKEPEVDMWEAGTLYPRWEQVVALAALTGKQPDFFMAPVRTLSMFETSMRFHLPRGEAPSLPVHRFTGRALAAAVRIGVQA